VSQIEKTVFICYRREDLPWALAVYKDLTSSGYDVFFDFMSINSGDFEQVILGNIKARAHFLVLLTPNALNRCVSPGDWVRLEIETAMDTKRNIIPVMLEGFDFRDVSLSESIHGKVSGLKRYNGLPLPSEYFNEAMVRLRERFLNVPLESVILPLACDVELATIEQKKATEKVLEKFNPMQISEEGKLLLEQEKQDAVYIRENEDNPITGVRKKARPNLLSGVTLTTITPLGKTFVTINEDGNNQPFEVLFISAKAGSETAAVLEAIGRLISLLLQTSNNIEPVEMLQEVIRQLAGIGGGRALGFASNRIRSMPDGIAHALEDYIERKESSERIHRDEPSTKS
jgi:hypothetical protein